MDYEEKYERALKKAQELQENSNGMILKKWLWSVFPELKESEDEKVRKALIRFHKSTIDVDGIKGEDIIAWLEKQGEFDDNIITRNDEILQAISIGLTDMVEDFGWSDFGGLSIEEIQNWLEKQGDNNNQNWKPSKEQINALEHFVRSIEESGYASPYDSNTKLLNSLLNDLYKLEGEPDCKRAERIDGVLTLVDEPKVDNRQVTERIKTFEDAYIELGKDHPLCKQYTDIKAMAQVELPAELLAYLRLRIIVAALNEGWEPKLEKDECRYSPCFYLYTKEQYDELDDEKKGRCVPCSGRGTLSYSDFANCVAINDISHSNTSVGSRLALRTTELADYAGRQFIEEWADFMFQK